MKRLLTAIVVCALLLSSGCVSSAEYWRTENHHDIQRSGEYTNVSVTVTISGATSDEYWLENTSVIFLDNQGEEMSRADIGKVERLVEHTVAENFSTRPAQIILQPADIQNPRIYTFYIGGLEWRDGRYRELDLMRLVETPKDPLTGKKFICEHELACAELNESDVIDGE